MAKAKHSTWQKTWHKTKAKLEGHKMTKKPIKWIVVKLSGIGIIVIFMAFSFNI